MDRLNLNYKASRHSTSSCFYFDKRICRKKFCCKKLLNSPMKDCHWKTQAKLVILCKYSLGTDFQYGSIIQYIH